MRPVHVEQQIHAPPETVFEVIAHIENFRNAVDDIVNVEFVGETQRGVGTVFRETRKMGKREATVEMEVVEYEAPRSLRILSKPDTMGTVWDSHFSLSEHGTGTKLSLKMTATSRNPFTKLMNALFVGMIEKAVTKDMVNLKSYCENAS